MNVYVVEIVNDPLPAGENQYCFRGASGEVSWPHGEGFALGPTGAWNLLHRLGLRPNYCSIGELPSPGEDDTVFVCPSSNMSPLMYRRLAEWLDTGGRMVATGRLEVWRDLFSLPLETARTGYPYAALAYLWNEENPEIIAPPNWSFARLEYRKASDIRALGLLGAVRGERQTPSRALITPIDNAPAVLQKKQLYYLNGNPFGAFQAWLQGQEDLKPWLAWRHRLFWLDEMAAFIGRMLVECGALATTSLPGPGIHGLDETTVILRHDLDDTRNTAYLEAESAAGFAGVHCILRDNNTDFWTKVLKRYPEHESAFHFTTNRDPNIFEAPLGCLTRGKSRDYRPSRRKICRGGLLRQVRWAKSQGVGVRTLHRHAIFMMYPEIIDGLAEVFDAESEVLGSSSFFRAQVIRWGVDRMDGTASSVGSFPDTQFPLWFPFRLAHAGNGGRMLRGWESTSVMEIEPELFVQMLDHRIPELPHRVFTLSFHPYHAMNPTFTPGGSLEWFRDILGTLKQRSCSVMTLKDLYVLLGKALRSCDSEK